MPTDWFGSNGAFGGGSFGGGGGIGIGYTPPPKKKKDQSDLIWEQTQGLVGKANEMEATENANRATAIGTGRGAYDSLTKTLGSGIDSGLLFSKASDAIGARAAGSLEGIRSSLGARGLNPNSGAASGMLSKLLYQQQNATTGAMLDSEIEAKRQRDVNAATSFAAALNLANLENAPISGIGYEAQQTALEGQLAKYGIDKQASSAKKANSSNVLGGLIGAGASVLSGLL